MYLEAMLTDDRRKFGPPADILMIQIYRKGSNSSFYGGIFKWSILMLRLKVTLPLKERQKT